MYRPQRSTPPTVLFSSNALPPAPLSWHPSQDPWTGMVQAWSMPWAAPSHMALFLPMLEPGSLVFAHLPVPLVFAALSAYARLPCCPDLCSIAIYAITSLYRWRLLYATSCSTTDTIVPACTASCTYLNLDTELGSSCLSASHE
jgi:hypothetical protein